jgi:DNA replication protein DnaC
MISDEELKQEAEKLEKEAEGIGRPSYKLGNGGFGVLVDTREAQRRWAEANPTEAGRYEQISSRLKEIEAELRRREEAIQKEARIWSRIDSAGVGRRNAEALKAGISDSEAVKAVKEWFTAGKTFLLLSGVPGAGKSLAAAYVVERVVRTGHKALFVRAFGCTRLSLFDAEDVEATKAMRSVDCLVIDDLGVESYHDIWRQTLEDVLDSRYQDQVATVLTTNLDLAGFKERYGERITDRIRHDGMAAKCGDQSMRRRA